MRRPVLSSLIAILLCAGALQAGTRPSWLSRAAISGNINEAGKLLAGGEKVNDVDWWGWTPLLWAAYYGQEKMVDFLLEQGADPNALTTKEYGNFKAGASSLILAAYYGQSEIVASLLARKADRGHKDAMGYTALDYAKKFNFGKCAELLEQPAS